MSGVWENTQDAQAMAESLVAVWERGAFGTPPPIHLVIDQYGNQPEVLKGIMIGLTIGGLMVDGEQSYPAHVVLGVFAAYLSLTPEVQAIP